MNENEKKKKTQEEETGKRRRRKKKNRKNKIRVFFCSYLCIISNFLQACQALTTENNTPFGPFADSLIKLN